jgi:formiminotetrahydrofolate cyclodeaminase
VASYSGALAASMICMAARLTIGKQGYEAVWDQAEEVEREGLECLGKLKEGVQKDMDVFQAYMDVLKLPKTTDEEKRLRTEKIRQASYDAIQPPMEIARNALKVVGLALILAPIGNKSVISDVGVASSLAKGAFSAALWSVEINLAALQDRDYVMSVRRQCKEWRSEARQKSAEAATIVNERIHSSAKS